MEVFRPLKDADISRMMELVGVLRLVSVPDDGLCEPDVSEWLSVPGLYEPLELLDLLWVIELGGLSGLLEGSGGRG